MKKSLVYELNQLVELLSVEEKELIETNRFSYIFSKAWLYIKLGPEKYRKSDAFRQPSVELDNTSLEVMSVGCMQILNGIVLTKENPFTSLNVAGFYSLFTLFHFKSIHRRTKHGYIHNNKRGALDCITFEHKIDKSQVVYFNFCEYQML